MTHIAISKPCASARRTSRLSFWNLMALARQRRDLSKLDERTLKDVGISRSDAMTEATRPVWDAPENWHKQLF